MAGIVFSLLMGAFYVLIRISIPADPAASGDWLEENSGTVTIALSLDPFAGIAFLWFIGVVRDRIGRSEDQFFSSDFFGNARHLRSPARGDLRQRSLHIRQRVHLPGQQHLRPPDGIGVHVVTRENLASHPNYAQVAGVLTYGTAAVLLFTLSYSLWVSLVFPIWVMMVSIYILVLNLRGDDTLANIGAGPCRA